MASGQEAGESFEQRRKRLSNERKICYRKKKKTNDNTERRTDKVEYITRHELRRMHQICIHCSAKFWIAEKSHSSSQVSPTLTMCCASGKICLPPLLKPSL